MRRIKVKNGWQVQIRWFGWFKRSRWRAIIRYGRTADRNWYIGIRGLFDLVGDADRLEDDAFNSGVRAARALRG